MQCGGRGGGGFSDIMLAKGEMCSEKRECLRRIVAGSPFYRIFWQMKL